MDLIISNDGLYILMNVTKSMLEHIKILSDVDCFDLCEIIRIEFTTYVDDLNLHVMKDGSGNFYGCICR
jgi:hypothetical protein